MATYKVMPLPDSANVRGDWQVKKGMRRISNHNKKSPAVSKAKRETSSGDTVQIRRSNGTIQKTKSM